MSIETQNSQNSREQELKREIAEREKEIAKFREELEALSKPLSEQAASTQESGVSSWNQRERVDDAALALTQEQLAVADSVAQVSNINLQSLSLESVDLSKIRLYRWWRNTITLKDAVDTVTNIPVKEIKEKVEKYLQDQDVTWLQKYLNDLIASWKVDNAALVRSLQWKWIWLSNWKILEDWKFGPQTLEVMKFILEGKSEPDPNPIKPDPEKPDEDVEKEPNLDWIKEEMSDAMQDVKNRWKGNRSPERNTYDNNFEIDTARNRVILRTWWVSLRSSPKEHISDNRCEIDWKTWDMYVFCKNNEYKMPLHFGGFALDSNWYPSGDNVNNREKVRAFTEVWNLMNMLKAHAVFNWKWAIEYQTVSWWERAALLGYAPLLGVNGIHINDGKIWWATDTLLISEGELNRLSNAYSHLWLKFDKATKIQIASLLTAMKLDLWKIRWNPDIEKIGVDPLDDEHKKWVKYYSKTYSGA